MSHPLVLLRSRRVGLASIILVVMLLVSPLLGAQATGSPVLQTSIQAASGAVLGTAVFTPSPLGGVMVYVRLRGFDPVAGSHRLAIANLGACCPPAFLCAGNEVLVLPDLQLLSDGSAEYTTMAPGITMEWLRQVQGSAIVLHADTNAASAVIGCGVISPIGATYPPRPGGPPHPGEGNSPRPGGPAHPDRDDRPAPVVARFRVVASAGLRLRGGPGTQYSILRIVPLGTILEAAGAEQYGSGMTWVRVRYSGLYYWAAKRYLQAW